MLHTIKKGFTLIELLVVITIIGILATGAVTTFTSQIQKARDTTRISDIKALEGGIQQSYQDSSTYPASNAFYTDVSPYIQKLPKDPKHSQPCNDGGVTANAPDCGYAYNVSADSNGILFGDFEVSTAFENSGNVAKKAAVDGWGTGVDTTRLEIWTDLTNTTTVAANAITTVQDGVCTLGGAVPTGTNVVVVINGEPSNPATSQCN